MSATCQDCGRKVAQPASGTPPTKYCLRCFDRRLEESKAKAEYERTGGMRFTYTPRDFYADVDSIHTTPRACRQCGADGFVLFQGLCEGCHERNKAEATDREICLMCGTSFSRGALRDGICVRCRVIQDMRARMMDDFNQAFFGRFVPHPPPSAPMTTYSIMVTAEQLMTIIKLCHPDRHGNSETANRITAWLLDTRRALGLA